MYRLIKKTLILISVHLVSCNSNHSIPLNIEWDKIKNPIYQHDSWSVKDACMIYKDSTVYIFFSAFFHDNYDSLKQLRSHVTAVKTNDFIHFSDTLFMWDGISDGWLGMCSPSIIKYDGKYILSYNSWGDKQGKVNQLFYAVSDDMENWEKHNPLAANLTKGYRAIDAVLTNHRQKFILTWKESKRINHLKRVDQTRVAHCSTLDGNWELVYGGYAEFITCDGRYSELIHENAEFINIDNKWHMLLTDYVPHNPWLYTMEGNPDELGNWQKWTNGYKLEVPIEERFNTNHAANAAFLTDWRKHDGYFYLLYAGRTRGDNFWKRGDNKLGLARSKDLINWNVPGK
jgi:hypothetical protein